MPGPTEAQQARRDNGPASERGALRKRELMTAARRVFERKGFIETRVSDIVREARVSHGTFYTYFDTKDEVFRALVKDLSSRVGQEAREAMAEADGALEAERVALESFLRFARENKEIYRIIDESEFVDPESFRRHYETTAERILARLHRGAASGELRGDLTEAHAWALMGMNVFLGLRFAILSDTHSAPEVAEAAQSILRAGIVAK